MSESLVKRLLEEQRAYYDSFVEFTEPAGATSFARGLAPLGSVLEIACGAGGWTRALAPTSAAILAIDSSPTRLRAARNRVPDRHVRFRKVDALAFEPEGAFDTVFMAYWLSHVPSRDQEAFVQKALGWTAPGGRLVIIDSRIDGRRKTSEEFEVRRAPNGRPYRVIKNCLNTSMLAGLLVTSSCDVSITDLSEDAFAVSARTSVSRRTP